MGVYVREASITAGQQFGGGEFGLNSSPGPVKVAALHLSMGAESKSWRVEKRSAAGTVVLLRSVDDAGEPAANTVQSVSMLGEDAPGWLMPGEAISIVTSGASAGMFARLEVET